MIATIERGLAIHIRPSGPAAIANELTNVPGAFGGSV